MEVCTVTRGAGAVVLGQPHGGTYLPPEIAGRLNENGRKLADTDWHITRLYDGLSPDATVVACTIHRYAIDANRDPSGASLYPGQNTTTLVPLTDFDGRPIWTDGQEPTAQDVEDRKDRFHAPYHAVLAAELERVRAQHGVAILFDCHSIRSSIPFLFEGVLPVLNTGTNGGETCAPQIEQTVDAIAHASGLSCILNGRFKGGWTTRHYGRPAEGIHTIQMEIAQRAYIREDPPWAWAEDRAARLRPHLMHMLEALSDLALSGALSPQGRTQ